MKEYEKGKKIWITPKNFTLIGFIQCPITKIPTSIGGQIDFDEVCKRTLGFTIC